MLKDLVLDTIRAYLPSLKQTASGWETCNCPVCHIRGHSVDKKNRLRMREASDGSIGINCFQCGFKTRWSEGDPLSKNLCWFLESIGVPELDVNKLKFESHKSSSSVTSSVTLDGNIQSKWKNISLPEDAMSIYDWAKNGCDDKNFLKVIEYIGNRGIMRPHDLFWSPSSKDMLNRRFIIPFYHDGNPAGYVSRYAGKPPSKKVPKYFGKKNDHYLYNLDNQKDINQKYCIITEGVLDAFCVNGVSPLGGKITQPQADIINRLSKEVILCPDRDDKGSQLVDMAISNGWKVCFPNWDHNIKDSADACLKYGRVLTVQSIIESAESDELKIKISRKMDNYYE